MLIQISYTLNGEVKTLTVNLLKQASDSLDLPDNAPIAGRNRQSMGQASKGYVQDCIAAAKAYPEVPSGGIDIKVLEDKLSTVMQMDEVLAVLQPLFTGADNIRRLHGQDLMHSSNEINRNFEYAAKTNAIYKVTSGKLKQRYARAKKEDSAAEKAAKAALKVAKAAVKTATNGVPA